MKKILAAVDFSEITERTVEQASAIAQRFSAEVTLLHVAAPDPDFVGLDAGPDVVRDQRARGLHEEHRRLQEIAEALRERGIQAKALLLQGPTVETILEHAQRSDVDLIVLGSHGRGAAYRALLGSISEGVLRRAGRPTLIVPAQRK